MTTFVLVSLASKKLDSQKPQFMLSETVFSTKNLKPSSVHCKNTSKTNMEGAVLWAVIEKSLQAEKARFNSSNPSKIMFCIRWQTTADGFTPSGV